LRDAETSTIRHVLIPICQYIVPLSSGPSHPWHILVTPTAWTRAGCSPGPETQLQDSMGLNCCPPLPSRAHQCPSQNSGTRRFVENASSGVVNPIRSQCTAHRTTSRESLRETMGPATPKVVPKRSPISSRPACASSEPLHLDPATEDEVEESMAIVG
jgi:hypothetical protein